MVKTKQKIKADPVYCDEVLISLVLHKTDKTGKRTWEQQTQPVKIFRASVPDIWAQIDKELATPSDPTDTK